MRSDHFDALGDVEAGRPGLDHEGGDAAGAGRFAGTGEDHIEIGNAAVGDEGLLAVDHVVAALGPRRGGHGGDVRAGLGLGQREGGDGGALGDARQIAAPELVRTGKRDRAAAEALHGEGEVGKPAVARQCFARDHQIARLQRLVRPAEACRDAMPQAPGGAERAHPAHAGRADISMAGVAIFHIVDRVLSPLVELSPRRRDAGRRKMGRPNVQSGSCLFSSRSKARISGRSPRDQAAITIPTANHCISSGPRHIIHADCSR